MIYSVSIINLNIEEELGLIKKKKHYSISKRNLSIPQRHNQQKLKLTMVHTICQKWPGRKSDA